MALCHKWVDVTHLVSSKGRSDQNITGYLEYLLPNRPNDGISLGDELQSIWFTKDGQHSQIFRSVSSNLAWAGSAIPQDVQDISNSAIANITILTCDSKRCNLEKHNVCASICVMYPCIRSYTVSIINGEFLQEQVSTSPAVTSGWSLDNDPDDDTGIDFGDSNGFPIDWVAAKSPC